MKIMIFSFYNLLLIYQLDINITGSIDEKQKAHQFAISMDTVAIRVSPAVIRLLSAVSSQFSEHQKKVLCLNHSYLLTY